MPPLTWPGPGSRANKHRYPPFFWRGVHVGVLDVVPYVGNVGIEPAKRECTRRALTSGRISMEE